MSGMTFSSLIDQWPSIAEFASDIGQKYETAKKWKQRDSIPSVHWVTLVGAARERGIDISIDELAAISQQRAA